VHRAVTTGWEGAKLDIGQALERGIRQALTNVANGWIDRGLSLATARALGVSGVATPTRESAEGSTRWPPFARQILCGDYGVVTIIGARNTGKTVAAIAAAEERQRHTRGGPIYFVNYPAQMAPEHITAVPAAALEALLAQAPIGATIIVDDASLLVNSKRAMTGRSIAFENLINTVAHRGLLLITTVQETSDLNKAALRADMYLLKPPERMFLETERPRMRLIMEHVLQQFRQIPEEDWVRHIYAWVSERAHGMVAIAKPEWLTHSRVKYRRALGPGDTEHAASRAPGDVVEGTFSEIAESEQPQRQGYALEEPSQMGPLI